MLGYNIPVNTENRSAPLRLCDPLPFWDSFWREHDRAMLRRLQNPGTGPVPT